MQSEKINYEIANKIILHLQRVLIGKIIPNLRAIILIPKVNGKIFKVVFYNDGYIKYEIKRYYQAIINEVKKNSLKDLNFSFEIARLDYPNLLPRGNSFVYLRKEPFKNPSELDIKNSHYQ